MPKCKICGCVDPLLFKNNNSRCVECVYISKKEIEKVCLKKKREKYKRDNEREKSLESKEDLKNKGDALFYSLIRAKIFRDGDVKKIRQATIEKILGG